MYHYYGSSGIDHSSLSNVRSNQKLSNERCQFESHYVRSPAAGPEPAGSGGWITSNEIMYRNRSKDWRYTGRRPGSYHITPS